MKTKLKSIQPNFTDIFKERKEISILKHLIQGLNKQTNAS